MATIKTDVPIETLLSEIHGKLGKLVIRQRNGKLILSAKPGKFNTPQDPESIARRNKFRTVSRFTIYLCRIPEIKQLWSEIKIAGCTARGRLMKYNFPGTSEKFPTEMNIITPSNGYFISWAEMTPDGRVTLQHNSRNDITEDDKILAVMALYDPVDSASEAFIMQDHTASCTPGLAIKIDIAGCSGYKKFILYTAILLRRERRLMWSDTFAISGELANNSFVIR